MADRAPLSSVLVLLVDRVRKVLVRDGEVAVDARFDEDLHADSLDLVEIIEGVEHDLAARGVRLDLPDDVLLSIRTVGEAAAAIHAHAGAARGTR